MTTYEIHIEHHSRSTPAKVIEAADLRAACRACEAEFGDDFLDHNLTVTEYGAVAIRAEKLVRDPHWFDNMTGEYFAA